MLQMPRARAARILLGIGVGQSCCCLCDSEFVVAKKPPAYINFRFSGPGGNTSAGSSTYTELALGLDRAIRVDGFLGGNSNPTSGDFSYGVHGALIEGGKEVRPVSEMNVSGNVFELLERFVEAADDPWTFSSWRTPTLLFRDIQFSGT